MKTSSPHLVFFFSKSKYFPSVTLLCNVQKKKKYTMEKKNYLFKVIENVRGNPDFQILFLPPY